MLLAAILPIASLPALCLLTILLALLIWRSDLAITSWLNGLLRLKWLFISIAILYCWFTPGASLPTPEFLPIPVNMPSYLGVQISAERSLVLVVLFGGVLLCLSPLKPADIVAGLRWMLYPFSIVRLPIELFSQRLAATLSSINGLQQELKIHTSSAQQSNAASWMNTVAERGAKAIRLVEANAFAQAAETAVETEAALTAPSARTTEVVVTLVTGSGLIAVALCL